MAFYPIIACVNWYDESTNANKHSYHPLYAASLAAATSIIEDHYGMELESVDVRYVDSENTLFSITKEQADHYIKEGAVL